MRLNATFDISFSYAGLAVCGVAVYNEDSSSLDKHVDLVVWIYFSGLNLHLL